MKPTNSPDLLDPPAVPEALPDIPGGETNLLPRQVWQRDLKVTFPLWGASSPLPGTEWVTLKWNGNNIAEKAFTTPIEHPDILFAYLPAVELREASTLWSTTSGSGMAIILTPIQ